MGVCPSRHPRGRRLCGLTWSHGAPRGFTGSRAHGLTGSQAPWDAFPLCPGGRLSTVYSMYEHFSTVSQDNYVAAGQSCLRCRRGPKSKHAVRSSDRLVPVPPASAASGVCPQIGTVIRIVDASNPTRYIYSVHRHDTALRLRYCVGASYCGALEQTRYYVLCTGTPSGTAGRPRSNVADRGGSHPARTASLPGSHRRRGWQASR